MLAMLIAPVIVRGLPAETYGDLVTLEDRDTSYVGPP